MRRFGTIKLLAPLALLGAVAGAVAAFCGGDVTAIKLPGQATRGVLSGDHFYTVADGRLVGVDLKQGQATVFSECYRLYPKLAPFVDAADGKACVSSDGKLHIIDLKSGQILHSADYKGEVHGLGFAGGDRVFVLGRTDVVVMDVAAGETMKSIPILRDEPNRPARPGALSACQKVGKLLYVADSDLDRGVKVVDLEEGTVQNCGNSGYDWYTGLQVVGDKAFVRTINLSYGINNPLFGCFDLKTKKYTDLKHPNAKFSDHVEQSAFDAATLVAGPDGGVCMTWKGSVYQFDADSKQVGETPLDKDDDGRLVGVWEGQALTAGKDTLRLTPLAKATAKGD